jgi:hypothetical protein
MAGENHQVAMTPLETKLRNLSAALNDAALEALASKGLLRRAQKDIERGVPVEIEDEENSSLCLKVDQFVVRIPEAGPAIAKCSCPAAGVCQHILAAILFLKRDGALAESDSPLVAIDVAERELLAITREQLEAWAGKTSFRAALELATHSVADITTDRGVTVHFANMNSRCHYAPGGGLDGIIVSGNAKDERRVAAAAVIAFQKVKGVSWELPKKSMTLEDVSGAPRTRTDVIEVTQQLLAEMIENGLARISQMTHQRLATLAVSATGVNLPRLALTLRGLSDECALITSRHARSDLGRLLGRMAHVHALCSAIQKGDNSTRPDLIGWHRTHYDEVGHLDLIGVSVWPWHIASGYHGLTLLLWDTATKRWNSWTESRPLHQQKFFQPVSRYTQPGPWEGAESPRQLARNAFRLMNARRNPLNRLSATGKSRILVAGPTNIHGAGLPITVSWDQLIQSFQSQTSIGLKENNPLDSIVAIRPTTWAQRGYDAVTQVFAWLLLDSQQRPLILSIAFDQFSEPAIKFLESASADSLQNAIVIGRIQRAPHGLTLQPFSIHPVNGEPIHLFLDTVKKPTAANTPPADDGPETEEDFDEEAEPVSVSDPVISRVLDEVDDVLLSAAESGVAGLNPLRIIRIQEIAPRTERIQLEALTTALKNVITQPSADTILRCAYIANLHRKATATSI